ncbi:MAG: hypothetical protein J7L53_09680 [Deltaproteobacteria bacterium]|nr:hypothetical protein [Deltaproteobacteria bacterium]
MEKIGVNSVPKEARDKHFMRILLKKPIWITGVLTAMVGGTICFMFAQIKIGPALVPGLMSSGLIVLAIGSVKIIGEKLNMSEMLGIAFMILGMLLLGLSGLEINSDKVREALAQSDTLIRITVFTVILFALWIGIHLLALKSTTRKGIIMAFSNGFPFSLSNFWVSPLIAVIFIVLSGKGSFAQIVIFVLASIILVVTNIVGIWQLQVAFKFSQVSNAIPVQQVPIQVTPVLVYFNVFALTPPKNISAFYIISGAMLIIISGFLLGRRRSEIEEMGKPSSYSESPIRYTSNTMVE